MADPKKARAPFAPWDRRELPGAFTVEESARRVGNYKWIEMRLFEVLGGWVATVPELDVKMRLGTHCYHHAWHAELWHKRLPELREMNPERLTLPANDELVAFVDAMTEPEAPELTIEKLVGVYRVLIPHKIAAYTYHLNNTSDDHRRADDPLAQVHPPGRVRGLARRRDAHPVAHRDRRRGRPGRRPPGQAREADAGRRRHRRPRLHRLGLRHEAGGPRMRKIFPADLLARDERFVRITTEQRFMDPRSGRLATPTGPGRVQADAVPTARRARRRPRADARHLRRRDPGPRGRRPHLLGLRESAPATARAPFELKLDMARQCWDEARHCEISVKLCDWMGTELGEFSESTFLYEAACNPDPVLRLTGVNRALEGLAIDVFNTMKEFGDMAGDPVLEFCEDWMLADEVTHVKMGSDWLRRLTENDPERRERALEFQRVVDKLFSLGGFRGEDDDSPIRLARRFRELAGFDEDEMDELAEISREAKDDADRMRRATVAEATAR